MLVPISWLKDYVEISVSPETLAKKLVATGFEVEEIIYQNRQVSNVVVGKIIDVRQHPNADRLRVTQIDVKDKTIQVVTNVAVESGWVIAVALDGAVLSGDFHIKAGELRGVMSEGMLCGLSELALTVDDVEGQDKDGIIRFYDDSLIGVNALDALGYNDVILDVAVTANRPDCNSIYKIAREVAVALKVNCKTPHINYVASHGDINKIVKVKVLNSDLCPRYMAAGVDNVKIQESPQIVKSRLKAVGIRPINNIVDITNYVLTEIGQPMHAFDDRELQDGKIVVRCANDGETLVSLDGKENKLACNMLVICDSTKPVAIAGIMGGLNSGVQNDTSAIVFESAKFARDSVRHTSKALNLRSDSSSRFEKGIDFASQELGLKRALTLVYEGGYGDVVEGIIDVKVDYPQVREIPFTTAKLQEILGCKVPKAKLIPILERLGIEVREEGRNLIAIVKEDREDIVGVNDIAEEFIRVYGYSHVKPTLFAHAPLVEGGVPPKNLFENIIKTSLTAHGLNECVTYSFTSPKFADSLKLASDDSLRDTIRLVNPLGEDLSVMRTTLTHSMIETLAFNVTHFNKSAKLYEIANVYIPKSLPLVDLPDEKSTLSIGMYGDDVNYYSIKSALDEMFNALHLSANYERVNKPFLHPGRSASVIVNGKIVGYIGEVHPDVSANYGIDLQRLYVAEISVDDIFTEDSLTKKKVKPFSKFPTMDRDLALVVDENVLVGDMISAINNAKIKFLTKVEVFDVYRSSQLGEGKKSVALSFAFECLDRTLTDEEIAAEMSRILNVLKRRVGAKIR